MDVLAERRLRFIALKLLGNGQYSNVGSLEKQSIGRWKRCMTCQFYDEKIACPNILIFIRKKQLMTEMGFEPMPQ